MIKKIDFISVAPDREINRINIHPYISCEEHSHSHAEISIPKSQKAAFPRNSLNGSQKVSAIPLIRDAMTPLRIGCDSLLFNFTLVAANVWLRGRGARSRASEASGLNQLLGGDAWADSLVIAAR